MMRHGRNAVKLRVDLSGDTVDGQRCDHADRTEHSVDCYQGDDIERVEEAWPLKIALDQPHIAMQYHCLDLRVSFPHWHTV